MALEHLESRCQQGETQIYHSGPSKGIRSLEVLFLESLPEHGDVLDGAPDGRAILLGGLSPLVLLGALGAPCFSMIQRGGRPDESQRTRPSPLPHKAPL